LKAVAAQWMDDIRRDNLFADVLLQHLYRWLSSPESKLYDPQLFNFVNLLMKICFSELIEMFKKRDAVFIFASYNKIIIETKKPDYSQTENYIDLIFESIMKADMFKYLRLNLTKTWRTLLFIDRFNFGGIDQATEDDRIT